MIRTNVCGLIHVATIWRYIEVTGFCALWNYITTVATAVLQMYDRADQLVYGLDARSQILINKIVTYSLFKQTHLNVFISLFHNVIEF
jgi:hypothetical protein